MAERRCFSPKRMATYSNRIRDGLFEFRERQYQLNNAQKHAIHGTLRDQSWQVVNADDAVLHATFDSRQDGSINWPWPLVASCELAVLNAVVTCQLKVTNVGESGMPIGGGWHPYFTRHLAQADPLLTIPVTTVYPDTNGDCLPIGAAEKIPRELDFKQAKVLDPEQRIDHCFAGLKDAMQIQWPDARLCLTLRASDNCTHAVLYNPDAPWFALEPVTHANDAINLLKQGIDAGLAVIEPGESWQSTLALQVSQPPT